MKNEDARRARAENRRECVEMACDVAPAALQAAIALMHAEGVVSDAMATGRLSCTAGMHAFEALNSNPQKFPMPHAAGRDVPTDPEPWASSGVANLLDAAGSTEAAISHMSRTRLRMIAHSLLMSCRRCADVDADGFRDALVAGGMGRGEAESAATPVRTAVAPMLAARERVEKTCAKTGVW